MISTAARFFFSFYMIDNLKANDYVGEWNGG